MSETQGGAPHWRLSIEGLTRQIYSNTMASHDFCAVSGETMAYLDYRRYDIDPYGRAHDGDMGWIRAGVGASQLEQAVSRLKDGEVFPEIESPYGFHLVTVLERIPGSHQPFAAMRDQVRQALVAERLKDYVKTLEQCYPAAWRVPPSGGVARQGGHGELLGLLVRALPG